MKKLTAGIFTVLLGVVAANSADAALTSQKYVDAKVKVNADAIAGLTTTVGTKADASTVTELSGKVTANTEAIAKKADQTAMETALAGKQQKLNSTNFKKDGTGNVISGVTVDESGNVTFATSNVATTEGLDNLKTTVDEHTTALGTLNGTAETTGSVANKIVTAISEEKTRADGAYDAKGAAGTAETNAKTYADGLAKNYATAEQGKTADDTAAAVNNATTGLATKASTTYVNEELAKKQNTLKEGANITISEDGTIAATYEYDDSALAGRVTTLEGTGVTKEKIDAIATNTANIAKKQDALTEAQLNAVNSGITVAGVTQIETNKTAVAAVTNDLANNYTKTADLSGLAKATIPATCTDPNAANGCALILKNGVYSWEVVERVDGE